MQASKLVAASSNKAHHQHVFASVKWQQQEATIFSLIFCAAAASFPPLCFVSCERKPLNSLEL